MSYTENLDLLDNFDAEPVDHTLIKNVPAHIRSTKAKYTEACSILLANTDALKKWLEVAHDNAEEAYVHKVGTARVYSGAAAPTVYFSEGGGGAGITPLTGSIYVDTSDSNMLYVLINTTWLGVKAADLNKLTVTNGEFEDWISYDSANLIGRDNDGHAILPAQAWCKSTVEHITHDNDIITKAYFDSIIKNTTMSASTTAVDFPNGLQIRFAKKTDITGDILGGVRSKEVSFSPSFSNNCLFVTVEFITANTTNHTRLYHMINTVSKDSFVFVYEEAGSEQNITGYYYFAIGY